MTEHTQKAYALAHCPSLTTTTSWLMTSNSGGLADGADEKRAKRGSRDDADETCGEAMRLN